MFDAFEITPLALSVNVTDIEVAICAPPLILMGCIEGCGDCEVAVGMGDNFVVGGMGDKIAVGDGVGVVAWATTKATSFDFDAFPFESITLQKYVKVPS
jgi:hypothetical protein